MDSGKHAATQSRGVVGAFFRILGLLVAVFVISFLLRSFVFQAYQIPSGSMEETIEIGDMVFAEKISYTFGEPDAGDIVTFDDPDIPGRTLIKRCIATEGETVNFVDGMVVVDGVVISEPYTNGKPSMPLANSIIDYPYTVPDGHIWVMGDNRTNSQDSRMFGSIPVESVSGHAVLTYWPLSSFGLLS